MNHELVVGPYVETPKGICAIGNIGGDHTLCGDAFDLASGEPDYFWRSTNAKSTSCPGCSKVIRFCKTLTVQRGIGK